MAAANSFTVFAGSRLLVVAASSEMEKNKWMEDLQAVIEHPGNQLDTDQLRYASLKSNSESSVHALIAAVSKQLNPGFPRLLESPGIVFRKFSGPGKSWKMGLVLESPGIC